MLLELNGGTCEVVTGVTLGAYSTWVFLRRVNTVDPGNTVYPVVTAPGYNIKSVLLSHAVNVRS